MMEFVHCNLCGSNDSILLYPSTIDPTNNIEDYSAFRCTSAGYGKHHAIVKCQQCGLVYANPRSNGEEVLEKYAKVEDPLYFEERQGRVITFNKHLRPLHQFVGTSDGRTLLDIGAHIGGLWKLQTKLDGRLSVSNHPAGRWKLPDNRERSLSKGHLPHRIYWIIISML